MLKHDMNSESINDSRHCHKSASSSEVAGVPSMNFSFSCNLAVILLNNILTGSTASRHADLTAGLASANFRTSEMLLHFVTASSIS